MPDTWIIILTVLAGAAIGLVAGLYLLVPRTDPKLEALRRRNEVEPNAAAVGQDRTQDVATREAAALLQQGKKIEAIKVYRQMTGVGLAEAKAAVERL